MSARQRAASSAGSNGFDQKVIRTGVERLDLVGEGAARGEHERRHRDARATQPAHQREPVGAGQSHIDHRKREFLGFQRGARRLGAAYAQH